MKLGRLDSRKRAACGEAVILFVAAGYTFAISAGAVDEIRNTDGLSPARGRKVHSVLERGQRRHYVVDTAAHFRLAGAPPHHVLVLRESVVALAVDSVDRMTHMAALYMLPSVFTGEERRWYRGLAVVEGRVVPVVNPGAFLTRAELAALDAAVPARPAGIGAAFA